MWGICKVLMTVAICNAFFGLIYGLTSLTPQEMGEWTPVYMGATFGPMVLSLLILMWGNL